MSDLPDYYSILEVSPTASAEDIKKAYKRQALRFHPDRVPVDHPERPERTKKFQAINDAFYTLSNEERRRDYDDARRFHTSDADEEIPRSQPGPSSWFSFGRSGAGGSEGEKFAHGQFESAFEEMMGEAAMQDENGESQDAQGRKRGPFYAFLGGLSGGMLGFIFANFPGAATGAVIGYKMGDMRDRKGQSVYDTFQQLPQNDKAKLLSELAARLFSGAIS